MQELRNQTHAGKTISHPFEYTKKEITCAKRRNWRSFCASIESASDASRLRKFLSVSPQSFCLLPKADDSFRDSEKEYLNLLLDTHLPGSEPTETTILADTCSNVHNFHTRKNKPFKTPVPDGIHPITIHNAESLITYQLIWFYKICLTLGYILQKLQYLEVIFIPKAR